MAAINHISMTARDLKSSLPFYSKVLEYLGLQLAVASDMIAVWRDPSGGPGFNLWQAKPELADRDHRIYAPGYHHLAFAADSRDQVDGLFELLRSEGFRILDPPQAYDNYGPGYYAVYFADPDGMKYELAFVQS